MGYIYKVAVPQDRWPSAAELDAALLAAGEPVRLLVRPDCALTSFEIEACERLAVEVDGEPHVVDARDFRIELSEESTELREIMSECGMDTAPLEGAHIFSITAHGDDRDWTIVRALVTRLVVDFGGYGIDFQSGLAGIGDWATDFANRLGPQQQSYHKMVAQSQIGSGGIEPN